MMVTVFLLIYKKRGVSALQVVMTKIGAGGRNLIGILIRSLVVLHDWGWLLLNALS
jgi:hypothetical protein